MVGKTSEVAVSRIVNLAEESKIASEGVKAPTRLALLSICKSLVAGGVSVHTSLSFFIIYSVICSLECVDYVTVANCEL